MLGTSAGALADGRIVTRYSKPRPDYAENAERRAMRLVLLVIPIALVALRARADDGDLQRTLIEAPCPAAEVTRLEPIGQSKIYEANCFGRRIKIICANGRCLADDPSRRRGDLD